MWIDYPTYYAKVLDNRQVYNKQHLLCKRSFTSSPISDYNDTYRILYSLYTISNNHITQYPILYGNSWKLSVLLILICLQIIYNNLQNLFDKIIVFQIDLSSIYHSFYIFITIVYRGVYLHISQYSFYTFCLDVFNTPNISLSFFNPLFSNFSITFFQFLPFPLNPSKSPLFLHFHYFSPISLKKHCVVSDVVQLPYLSHFLQLHLTKNDPIFYFFAPNTPLNHS